MTVRPRGGIVVVFRVLDDVHPPVFVEIDRNRAPHQRLGRDEFNLEAGANFDRLPRLLGRQRPHAFQTFDGPRFGGVLFGPRRADRGQ
jgi:hypothetical protein